MVDTKAIVDGNKPGEFKALKNDWEIHDDVTKLRRLISKLQDNWVTDSDRKFMSHFFRQCANEV